MSARDTDINIDFNVKYKSLEKAEEAVDDLISKASGKGLGKLDKAMNNVTKSSSKLDKAVSKTGKHMEKSFGSKVSSALEKMRTKMSQAKSEGDKLGKTKVDGLTSSIFKAVSAVELLKTGFSKVKELAVNSFKGAIDLEQTELALDALMGDAKKSEKLFDMLNQKGMKSVFSEEDFLTGGKALLPLTKDLGTLEQGMNVMERLAMSNMDQGMEGATFAMREYLSGDITSIVERFNLPRSMVRESLKNADTIEERMTALDELLQGMGFTDSYVAKVNTSTGAVLDNMISNVQMKLKTTAGKVLERLKEPLSKLQQWLDSGALDGFFEGLGNVAVGAVEGIINAFMWLKENGVFEAVGGAIKTIKDTIVGLWNWLQSSGVIDGIGNMFKWLVDNKDLVIAAIAGITTAFIGFKIKALIPMIPLLWAKVAAWWAVTAAMLANPITWIIIGIGLLVAAIVLLVLKWDWVKTKAQELWNKIKLVFTGIWNTIKAVFTGIWNSIVSTWNSIWNKTTEVCTNIWNKITSVFTSIWESATNIWNTISLTVTGFAEGIKNGISNAFNAVRDIVVGVWEGIKGAVKGGINFVIKGINAFIGGLNNVKVPDWVPGIGGLGFNIGLIPEFAKGTNGLYNTPDTFIAGEQGPELIVGAKGRRVLNNDETNEALAPTSAGVNNSTSNNTYNITINVQGGDNPKQTAKSVRDELEDFFASFNRRNPRLKEI